MKRHNLCLRRFPLLQSALCPFRKSMTPTLSLIPHHQRCLLSTQSISHSVLDEEQKEFLTENGYLWIKQFVPQNVARNVQRRINHLLDNFDPESTKSIFRTHRTEEQHKDLYFLESGDKIRFFWEEHAFDDQGNLTRDARVAINKIGHALHTLDPVLHSYVYGYLPQLTYDIGMKAPIPVQSMYICKQPGIGGEVGEHQDSTFLLTEPVPSVHGLWLCIDDTTVDNGCVYCIPKSHKDPAIGLRNRFRRMQEDKERTEMVPLIGDGSLPKTHGIPIEAKCGDLLVIHGELVHWSEANLSEDSRHALMVHCVDGQYDWPDDNWLQYPEGKQSFPRFTAHDVEKQVEVRQRVLSGNII